MNAPDRMVLFAKKILGIAPATELKTIPLARRGSDRAYFRIFWGNTQSAILMQYNPERQENACFAEIGRFLDSINIPTARILGHDPIDCFIIQEDLGDMDLWALRHVPWEKRRSLYRKTLSVAQRLHSYPINRFPADRIKLADAFGTALYRWEQNYFMDNFTAGLCGIHPEPPFLQRLQEELTALAERLSGLPRCLVHRDLQSQNVMICGDEPYLIDFQGMRFGTLFYDLGSLLFDPYVEFSEKEREELLHYYFSLSESGMERNGFRKALMEASAQRLMQALGAYGFLGITLGLKNYLEYVPSGLGNLSRVVQSIETLPRLQELVSECGRTFNRQ